MPLLTAQDRLGTTVGGKYRLHEVLAAGGMGVLFRGEHTWTGRQVAIKMLRARELVPGDAGSRRELERFVQEARAAATLEHPHVVDILDMGTSDDGMPFIVMELLRGEPLSQALERESPLTPEQALGFLLPIMGALAVAHDKGIVHRDLKPANVFLASEAKGRLAPKLLDFGIAKLRSGSTLTDTGMTVGTPEYMAPEQAAGQRDADSRCDVWAMGAMLYRSLSGAAPFAADTPQALLVQIVNERPAPLSTRAPHVPKGLCAVIDRALAREPGQRPADMRELARALVLAARRERIALPPDPDPLGLPEYGAWLEAQSTEETAELSVAPSAPRSAPAGELGQATVRARAGRALWLSGLLAIAGLAVAWSLWSRSADVSRSRAPNAASSSERSAGTLAATLAKDETPPSPAQPAPAQPMLAAPVDAAPEPATSPGKAPSAEAASAPTVETASEDSMGSLRGSKAKRATSESSPEPPAISAPSIKSTW